VSRRSLYDNEDSIQPHPDNDDSSSLHSEPSSEGKEKAVQPEPDLISEEVSSKSIKGWKGIHGKILQKPLGQPIVSKRSSLNVSSVRSRTSSAASEYSMNDAASLKPLRRNTIASYAQEKSTNHTPRGSIRSLQRSRASSAVSEYSDADRPMNIDRRMTYGSMTYSSRGTRANSLVTPSSGRSHRGSMRELQNWRSERPRTSDDNISEYSDADRPQLSKLATFGQLPTSSTDLLRTPSLLTNSTSESMNTSEYSDADTSSIATKFSRTGSQFSQMTRQSSFAESQISLNKEETTKDTFDTIDVSSDSVKPSLSLKTSLKTSE